jgi:hypothetical protein
MLGITFLKRGTSHILLRIRRTSRSAYCSWSFFHETGQARQLFHPSHKVRSMSTLPLKADTGRAHWDVRFVPKADVSRCSKIRHASSFAKRFIVRSCRKAAALQETPSGKRRDRAAGLRAAGKVDRNSVCRSRRLNRRGARAASTRDQAASLNPVLCLGKATCPLSM